MKLSEREIEALSELITIGMGRGAKVLNTILPVQIALQVSQVRVLTLGDYVRQLEGPANGRLSAVQLGYQGSISGQAQLIIPIAGASRLVTLLTGEALDSDDFDMIQAGTLCEVGNMVINGVMDTISRTQGQQFVYSVPTYLEEQADHVLCMPDRGQDAAILMARTRFLLSDYPIEGDLLLSFEVGALETLVGSLGALLSHE